MPPNWCMTCRNQPQCRPAVLVADWVAALSARSLSGPCGYVAAFQASSAISHVIPLQLLQTLYLHRWNCNVLRGARKMTVGNYVRLFRQSPVIPLWSRAGPALAALWSCRGPPGWLRCRLEACPGPAAPPAPSTLVAFEIQRKRGPAPADPRLNRCYSWSSPRPRGVI